MNKRIEHFKNWQIWRTGYAATGEHDTARQMNVDNDGNEYPAIGRTFQEACDNFFKVNLYGRSLNSDCYYNSEKLTYWGCKLHDNEKDARNTIFK